MAWQIQKHGVALAVLRFIELWYHWKSILKNRAIHLLGLVVAASLLIYGTVRRAEAQQEEVIKHEEAVVEGYTTALAYAIPNPVTESSAEYWLNEEKKEQTKRLKALGDAQSRPRSYQPAQGATVVNRAGYSSQPKLGTICDRNPNAVGCCVEKLKDEGILPNKKITKNGYAGSIPTKPLDVDKLKDGQSVVIVTKEGSKGHVLEAVKQGDKLVSKTEGGMGRPSEGRVVSKTVIKGVVNLQ